MRMLLRKIILIAILFILFLVNFSEAKIQKPTLQEIVNESSFIFVGTVKKVTNFFDKDNPCQARQAANIFIIRKIKMNYSKDAITLNACEISVLDDATFKKGETCLLFVDGWKGNYKVAWGNYGKIIVENNYVMPRGIIGYGDRKITLDKFVESIFGVVGTVAKPVENGLRSGVGPRKMPVSQGFDPKTRPFLGPILSFWGLKTGL